MISATLAGSNFSEHQVACSGKSTPTRLFTGSLGQMNPLHPTIEEFATEGYTHIECSCPRCRMIRLRPMGWLPKISMGLNLAQLSSRLRCAECGGPLRSLKPWRQADVLGKPQGRRG
jgi:hypothetical protein